MRGAITGWDVIEHLPTVWHEYGARCALRCLWALARGRKTTFLELAWAAHA